MTAAALEIAPRGAMELVWLRQTHLRDAAGLFVAAYRAARRREPLLPHRHEDVEAIVLKLGRLSQEQPGVAAMRGDRLVGFLLGKVLPEFRGHRSIYVPEWAHAAAGDRRGQAYRAMYAQLSPRWVADGCFTHLITTFAGDRHAAKAWFWLGFGMIAVDAVRGLGPVQGVKANVEIRAARSQDLEEVLALHRGIQRHMAAAPMFVPLPHPVEKEVVKRRQADPAQASFLAYRGPEAVGYVHVQPANPSAAYVIQDPKTASIRAAFTKERCRRVGIGAALLDRALDWARSHGYERCAVDFETQNIPGARFWLRHFRPVCCSMIRRVDGPTRGARAGREGP